MQREHEGIDKEDEYELTYCPKCNEEIELTRKQVLEMMRKEETKIKCPSCNIDFLTNEEGEFEIDKQREEEIEYKFIMDKLIEKERKRKIEEKVEKDFYGKIKSKRNYISAETRESILKRFNYKCAICDGEEGLCIHHKDKNPKNNNPKNLLVLCSVCHKKIHMKIR